MEIFIEVLQIIGITIFSIVAVILIIAGSGGNSSFKAPMSPRVSWIITSGQGHLLRPSALRKNKGKITFKDRD